MRVRGYEGTKIRRYAFVVLLGACQLGESTPTTPGAPGTPRPTGKEPVVRVGIKLDTAAVFISAAAAAEIVGGSGEVLARPAANERWTFTANATQLKGAGASGDFTTDAQTITFRAPDNVLVSIGDSTYRGDVIIRRTTNGRVSAINLLEMEDYLLGVVPFEIGRLPASEIEATKVQAIAARTYAIANLGSKNAIGFDFYNTVADQVYRGTSGEDSVTSRAVRETRGQIITHNGQPIIAYYSSTCGGHTADADESWPWRPPQPYLRGKPDVDANGQAYCSFSRRFRWDVSWSGDSLKNILQATLRERLKNPSLNIAKLQDVRVVDKTKSGRVELEILADGQSHRIRTDSIRWTLRPTPQGSLNSSLLFDVKSTISNGELARLDVHGGGWGHAVGMCQVGAIGRARAGQDYRTILNHYYTDVEITSLY